MTVFDSLTPAEQAKHLRNPEGTVGLAVAEWLAVNNSEGNVRMVAALRIEPGNHVLEIGFGSGRAVPHVLAQAADVHYAGVDISETMVEEASRFNAAAVAEGRAGFHLGSSEHMTFADGSFDRIFSVGVAHFWAEPIASLAEIRRVLRPGGVSLIGCLHPLGAPPFARKEYGFHLHDAETWEQAYRSAGFAAPKVEAVEMNQIGPDGTPITRHGLLMAARA